MKTLTIVSDEDSNERLYVDKALWTVRRGSTVYAVDIAEASEGQLVLIVFHPIEFYHHDWPDTLEAALVKPDYCV